MKVLFVGGTGTISMAITRLLAERGEEVWLLNRGNRNDGLPDNVNIIRCDINRPVRNTFLRGIARMDSR